MSSEGIELTFPVTGRDVHTRVPLAVLGDSLLPLCVFAVGIARGHAAPRALVGVSG